MHLTPDPTHATVIQGPNGRGQLAPNMLIRALSIGSIPLGQRSIPLGALPGLPILTPPIAGLMGVDLLRHFDIEFDVPHRRLILWRPALHDPKCTALPAWPEGYTTLNARREGTRLSLSFTLDGHKALP
ncbi:hypothetical protein [Asaia prunellae]|uniref:hypothetical protein n=1 Tax=Asaia prunellae TaxID=610245 RepID=UPI000684FB29|nr:hypothetical protein [Asaia prunellae]